MSAFWRGLFTYLLTMGYAKYLRKRDTLKYHAFFCAYGEQISFVGTFFNQ